MGVKNTDEGLKRVIGVPSLAATIVNNTIGAGIYALPATVCIAMGASGILAYLFCGAMLVAIMLCYMEIGSKVTATGGSYIYVETVFGPLAGFIINCLFFVGWGVLGSAAIMNILADSLAVLFPVFSNVLMRALLFFILLGSIAWVNVRGAKQGVKVLEYITVIKLIPLLGVIIFGFSHVKINNLHWEHWPSVNTLGKTVLILFFAFAGFETSLSVSGEIKDPKRTLPRGIALGAVGAFSIYILLHFITQGVLGAQIAEYKDAPLAAVAERIIGPIGVTILIIGAIVSCLGNTSGDLMATPRLLFSGANKGLFPKFIGKVHPRFATPYRAVIIYAGLIFIFAATGSFEQLAIIANSALLIIYLTVILAMIKLRTREAPSAEKTFKVPGGLLIPCIAIAAIVWLLANLTAKEIMVTSGFIVIICGIYFLMKKFKNQTQKKADYH